MIKKVFLLCISGYNSWQNRL